MNLELFIFLLLLIRARSKTTNNFILDYFYYKRTSSVVGYSCSSMADDILLIKHFNKNGVYVAFNTWADVTGIQFAANTKYYKIGIFLDTRCHSSKHIASLISIAADRQMYGELHCWLIISDNLSHTLNITESATFGFSTDFVVAVSSDFKSYQLYDVYRKFKATLNVTFYGSWRDKNGFDLTFAQENLMQRSNFNSVILKVIFFQSSYKPKDMPLAEYFQSTDNIGRDTRIKFGYNIVIYLSEMYNFTNWKVDAWRCYWTIRKSFCKRDSRFDRNIDEYECGKSIFNDIFASGLAIQNMFYFSKSSTRKSIKTGEIFRPFAASVWHLMVIVSLLSMKTLFFVLYRDYEGIWQTITNCFTLTVGAICQQCTDIEVTRYSTRIVVFVIMIYSLVMYNYYSACVVSSRLDEPIYKINDSLVELGKLNLKMGSEKMSYINYFFTVPFWEIKVFRDNYWLKISESERIIQPEIGMRLVKKGGFAYHVHPDVAYAFIEKFYDHRETCELMEVHLGFPTDTMFGVTKNSTFKEILKVGFTKITEVGIRRRQINRWRNRKPLCRIDILSASSVTIYEFAPHLIMLVVGALLSIFFIIIELIISKWIMKNRLLPTEEKDEKRRINLQNFYREACTHL